ncbi:MAG: gliding motility lipoprotein GldB [Phocaeicola sp.]
MYKRIVLLIVSIVSLFSCLSGGGKVSHASSSSIIVHRYDRLQYEFITANSFTAIQRMSTEFPRTTKLMIEDVLAIGEVNSDKINERMYDYFQDTTLLKLFADAEEQFRDLDWLEEIFNTAVDNMREEMPDLTIPRFYAQFSALNESVVVADTMVGFSIDKYMGSEYPLYKRFYYEHQRHSMKPDRIAPDCITYYLMSEYPTVWMPRVTLLDVMIMYGKINWVASKLLDYDVMEKILDYDEKEIEWCRKNKHILWNTMLQKKHLESTDTRIIYGYTHREPIYPILQNDAPMTVGIWMGMLIVDAYMKKHKEVSFTDLLEMQNHREILTDLNFNP